MALPVAAYRAGPGHRFRARRAVLAGVLAAVGTRVLAQQAYPAHPVRLVVAGAADQVSRLVADRLTAMWGQAVYVDLRGGGGGVVGTDFVAKSPPDGYNWLLSSVNHPINIFLQPSLPYNFEKDFTPVAMIATLPFVLVVNNDLPVHSVPELVALAKAQPGKLNYASGGAGGPGHLAGEMLKQMAGIDVVHVPYRSVGPAVADVIAGQAQWSFSPAPAVLELVQAGKLRAIAVGSGRRFSHLPDVPTVAEQGWPDYELMGWNGIHVPARTPLAIVDKIAADVAQVMASPDVQDKARAAGVEPVAMTRGGFAAFVQADIARIGKVVRDGNIRAG